MSCRVGYKSRDCWRCLRTEILQQKLNKYINNQQRWENVILFSYYCKNNLINWFLTLSSLYNSLSVLISNTSILHSYFSLTCSKQIIAFLFKHQWEHFLFRIIKSRKLRWAWYEARIEEGTTAFKIVTGKPTERELLVRPRPRWEDKIRIDLKKIDVNARN